MQPRYTERFILSAADVDLTGRWRPSNILTSMQNAGIAHSELLGCGRAQMLGDNKIWVLSRTHVHMDAYPMMDEEVVTHTWPGKTNRFFFPRYHVFERPDGTPLGCAAALWLILDVEARKIVLPAQAAVPMPDTSMYAPPLPLPERVTPVEGEALVSLREPRYTDLDVNGHVNNARYADWVCDALPLDMQRTHALQDLLLNYSKEIWPGQHAQLTLRQQDDRFSLTGEAPDGDPLYFEAGGCFMPWHSDRRV